MRPRPSRTPLLAGLLCGLLLAGSARPATGQDLVPGLLGGAAGLAAGGFVSVGIWTAKARYQDEYLFSAADALGWETTPILVGMGTGAAVGLLDPERLRRTVIGGGAGFLLGTGIGMTIGAQSWRLPEGRWAGGLIGGAAGILLGSTVGLLWPAGDDDEGTPAAREALGRSIPLGITIRF